MEQMPGNYQHEEEVWDFRKYLFMFLRKWYWFAISLFIAYSVAYYVNRFSEPVYNVGGAQVVVRHERMRTQGMERFIEGIELLSTRSTIQNQIETLRSFTLNRRVVDSLDFDITYVAIGRFKNAELYKRADIRVTLDDGHPQRRNYPIYVTILSTEEYRLEIDENLNINQVMPFGEPFRHENFSFTIDLVNHDYSFPRYYFVINDRDRLANIYRNRLRVRQNDPNTGSILALSTSGKVPQQETDYLNMLMEVFVRANLEEKNETAVNTIQFIDTQLKEIVDSLQQVEGALTEFQQRHNITNVSRETGTIFSRVERWQGEMIDLHMRRAYFEYLENYISARSAHKEIIAPSVVGINDPLLGSLISQLNQLYADRRLLAFNVQENNPKIIQIDSIIEEVTATLLENLSSLMQVNQMALSEVEKRLSEVEGEVGRLPLVERQWLAIDRRFSLNNNLYNYLMEKRSEALIAQAANISDNRILDYSRAGTATIVSPNRSRNYSMAILIGLGLPFIIIFLADQLNTKITDRSFVNRKTKVPILGNIGHNTFKHEIPVEEKPKSAISESFRSLRTNLRYVLKDDGPRVISITSTISGEGKTFCAVNLAAIIAASGHRTLLMGLDLRKPKINKIFGFDREVGLSTYLIGKYNEEEIIEKSDIENLDIITSGPIPPNPAELLQSAQMDKLIEIVRSRYEYIIFDTPPVAVVSDAMIVNRFADLAVFVVRLNFSNNKVLDLINELYQRKEVKNLNILLNDVKHSDYYGYNYGYYGYGYGYGYGSGYYGDDNKQGLLNRIGKFFKS